MKNRIAFKVISTGLNFFISIVIGVLVPRAIGPVSYGEFNYINSTYTFLFQLLMFTSSTAYIYFLSKSKHKIEDVNSFYIIFLIVVSISILIISLLSINSDLGMKYLWNELNDNYLILMGLIFGVLFNFQQRFIEYSDSTSQTIKSEKIKLFSRFVFILSVIALIFTDMLNIYWFYALSVLNAFLFVMLFISFVKFRVSRLSFDTFKIIFLDFYIYLKPLIMFSLVASIYTYFGKYTLQSSSGSIEQGYYNFAYQLALIPVVFISSIMAIYMSEMTKKFELDDLCGVKEIFVNNVFKVYAVHAFIALFMFVNSESIILVTVGDSFLGATEALKFLSLFSLSHTFGMLSGNIFFSCGRNKQYSIINSTVMVLGIISLVYFLHHKSMDSGCLAFIMMSFYMLRVSIQLYLNLNYLGIKKSNFLLELFLVTIIVLINFMLVSTIGLNIFINLLLSLVNIVIINFMFNDYLKVKKLKS